jgi:hypothetical protein
MSTFEIAIASASLAYLFFGSAFIFGVRDETVGVQLSHDLRGSAFV